MTLRATTTTAAAAGSTKTTPGDGQHLSAVKLLVLGAGWTWQFLRPALVDSNISYQATTTTGHDGTIPFRFDPDSDDPKPFSALPDVEYVLVTFPLKGRGPSARLVELYGRTRNKDQNAAKWIQFGSTGIYTAPNWSDSTSPVDPTNERGVAEDELLGLGGCVLNLAGLYGGERQPQNWMTRVAKTKEQLAAKGALHLIHGVDVARAVVGVLRADEGLELDDGERVADPAAATGMINKSLFGKRWIVADCVSYDWWSLAWDWTGNTEGRDIIKGENHYRKWVFELMQENHVRGLPRSVELLGRKLDAREFWTAIGSLPSRTLGR
jgi:hypothetical protein